MSSIKKLVLIDPEDSTARSRQSADQLAGYFYRITNHEELFRAGKEVLKELKKGIKGFAFTSIGNKKAQQDSILGLCCFFDQSDNYKIAIVSDKLNDGFFGELVNSSSSHKYSTTNSDDVIHYKSFHQHFDFIEYKDLMNFYERHTYTKDFEAEIKKMLGNYDLVFWDLPEISAVKKHPHFHYRMASFYQWLSVVVKPDSTSGKDIESIKKFYANYDIGLNAVLLDLSTSGQSKGHKKLFGIF